MPEWTSRLRRWIVSNLSWTLLWWLLVAGGGAAVIAAISTAYSGIHGVLRYLLLVGAFMFGSGFIIAAVRLLAVALPGRVRAELNRGPGSSLRQNPVAPSLIDADAERADAYERKARVAIHEVITNLEEHDAVIRALPQSQSEFDPDWQGNWGDGRDLLAEDRRYDNALRETERAFQAINRVRGDGRNAGDALARIANALAELNAALARGESR
jgi:hypothetical protein